MKRIRELTKGTIWGSMFHAEGRTISKAVCLAGPRHSTEDTEAEAMWVTGRTVGSEVREFLGANQRAPYRSMSEPYLSPRVIWKDIAREDNELSAEGRTSSRKTILE